MISSQLSYRRIIFKIDLKLQKNYKFRIIWVENIYVLFMQVPLFLGYAHWLINCRHKSRSDVNEKRYK